MLDALQGSGTPFQSAAWIDAFLAAHAFGEAFRLIEISDPGGARLLLPVVIERRYGARLAVKPGGAHASFLVPPHTGDITSCSPRTLKTALLLAGTIAGFDGLVLEDCPIRWNGAPHPLLGLPHSASPSDAATLAIDAPPEAVLDQLFDRDQRKKQRYKRRKLTELGVLTSGWADPGVQSDAALARFFSWKAGQFAAAGIADPFASPEMRAFLGNACRGAAPPIRLFVLFLDDAPIAVIGVARAGTQASGMVTAYTPDAGIARFSPGDVLMADLIVRLAAEGVTGFDLGVGEARYKSHFCPERLALVDIAMAGTARGRLAVAIWRVMRWAKRLVKQNPALFEAFRRARKMAG
jgi:CelD/BcsL family acetyltransferase involved in cellulose biosynthesis